jgi:DNA (cytosine-5)-methyltransferase 1
MLVLADLFSGCGGFSHGAHSHRGYKIDLAVDNWLLAQSTYEYNFPATKFLSADLHDRVSVGHVVGLLKDNCDLIIGGPPCQGFSTLGLRGDSDKRSELVERFWKIVKSAGPDVAIMENVKSIRTMRHRSGLYYPEFIRKTLESGGQSKSYEYFDVLIDCHLYGLAQTRCRYFGVAVKRNSRGLKTFQDRFLSKLQAQKVNKKSVLRDAIGDLPRVGAGEGHEEIRIKRGKSTRIIYNHRAMAHGPELVARLKHVPVGGGLLDVPVRLLTPHLRRMVSGKYGSGGHVKNIYGRLSWEEACGTVVAGIDKITCGRFVHPVEHRLLTPRECARLQSFPDEFRFFGSLVGQYYQIGNAVPPKIAEVVLSAVYEAMVGARR